jgi:phosphatidylglycerol:prolipoprotein diacylglycerol transferase
MFEFLHTFNPSPILVSIGPLHVYWYGLLMAIGSLLGLAAGYRLAPKIGLKKTDILDAAFYFAIGAVVGARIYYVIYAWELYRDNWLDIFKIWEGGLAVHGVMLGGFFAILQLCYKRRMAIGKMFDLVAIGLVTGQIVGRWGNYFNQEIFGQPTTLPWGIPIAMEKRPLEYVESQYFHPTCLYESLGNIVILGLLLLAFWLKIKKKIKLEFGFIFDLYLIGYSLLRMSLETLRIDYSPVIFGLRWPMIMSLLLLLFGIVLLVINKFRALKK